MPQKQHQPPILKLLRDSIEKLKAGEGKFRPSSRTAIIADLEGKYQTLAAGDRLTTGETNHMIKTISYRFPGYVGWLETIKNTEFCLTRKQILAHRSKLNASPMSGGSQVNVASKSPGSQVDVTPMSGGSLVEVTSMSGGSHLVIHKDQLVNALSGNKEIPPYDIIRNEMRLDDNRVVADDALASSARSFASPSSVVVPPTADELISPYLRRHPDEDYGNEYQRSVDNLRRNSDANKNIGVTIRGPGERENAAPNPTPEPREMDENAVENQLVRNEKSELTPLVLSARINAEFTGTLTLDVDGKKAKFLLNFTNPERAVKYLKMANGSSREWLVDCLSEYIHPLIKQASPESRNHLISTIGDASSGKPETVPEAVAFIRDGCITFITGRERYFLVKKGDGSYSP